MTDDEILGYVFAGSGSIGIEAISLGAQKAIFFEKNRFAANCIMRNLESLGISQLGLVINKKTENIPSNFINNLCKDFNNLLFFIDPPYKEKELLRSQTERIISLFSNQIPTKDITLVIESDEQIKFADLEQIHEIHHGNSYVLFGKCQCAKSSETHDFQ